MSYLATVLKIMIASPSDVLEERKIIREVIHEWNAVNSESRSLVLIPVGWESHASPAFGRPQAVINDQVLTGADLLVATFWTRIGSATGKAVSGTIEEIDQHIMQGKPAMLYFSSVHTDPHNLDSKQWEDLRKFRQECQERSLYEPYASLTEFREKFNRQLAQTILREYGNLIISAPTNVGRSSSNASLSDNAKLLLGNAIKDVSGEILKIRTFDGLSISTNNLEFVKHKNAKDEARWEAVVEELIEANLIKAANEKGVVFRVTKLGYEMEELI